MDPENDTGTGSRANAAAARSPARRRTLSGRWRRCLRGTSLASAVLVVRKSLPLVPRTQTADRVARSICPYCGVGCGQLVYVENGKRTASLAATLWPSRSRTRTFVAGALGTASALLARFAIVDAGRASAADPRATFEPQRR